jgi:hypothetical protein
MLSGARFSQGQRLRTEPVTNPQGWQKFSERLSQQARLSESNDPLVITGSACSFVQWMPSEMIKA